jgi:hypothetical protein
MHASLEKVSCVHAASQFSMLCSHRLIEGVACQLVQPPVSESRESSRAWSVRQTSPQVPPGTTTPTVVPSGALSPALPSTSITYWLPPPSAAQGIHKQGLQLQLPRCQVAAHAPTAREVHSQHVPQDYGSSEDTGLAVLLLWTASGTCSSTFALMLNTVMMTIKHTAVLSSRLESQVPS